MRYSKNEVTLLTSAGRLIRCRLSPSTNSSYTAIIGAMARVTFEKELKDTIWVKCIEADNENDSKNENEADSENEAEVDSEADSENEKEFGTVGLSFISILKKPPIELVSSEKAMDLYHLVSTLSTVSGELPGIEPIPLVSARIYKIHPVVQFRGHDGSLFSRRSILLYDSESTFPMILNLWQGSIDFCTKWREHQTVLLIHKAIPKIYNGFITLSVGRATWFQLGNNSVDKGNPSFGDWEWAYKPCCPDVTLLSTFFPVDAAAAANALNLTGNIKLGPVLIMKKEKDKMTVSMGDRCWTFCMGEAGKTFTWINDAMLQRLIERKRKIVLYLSLEDDELISVVKIALY